MFVLPFVLLEISNTKPSIIIVTFVIFSLLLQRASATQDALSVFGENPALVAAGEGQTLSVQLLFSGNLKFAFGRAQQRDINGTTVLMAAVARGNNDLALWLLKRFGKKLAMLPNNFHMLPLHVAAAKGMQHDFCYIHH